MAFSNKANEKRTKKRFPMERELRYRVIEEGVQSVRGVGQTLNMSSTGAAFTTQHAIKQGAFVELSISWPVLLGESCPMRLIAFGRILRNDGHMTVCSIDKYEFRTAGRTLQALPIERSDGMLQRWADGVKREAAVRMAAAG